MRSINQSNIVPIRAGDKKTGKRRMHHYRPGTQLTPRPEPRATPDSIPSAAATPPPSPTSPPLSMAFDDDNGARNLSGASYETEQHYIDGGLGDGFFSDLFTQLSDAYKAQQAAKAAASQAATAQAQAAQAAALRSGTSLSTGPFLGLTTTTWLMLAGAGLGAYLLLSRKKRR